MSEKAEYHPEWEPDCLGKWDYDCPLVSLSCRYWPYGGGFDVYEFDVHERRQKTRENTETLSFINPSAKASICIGDLKNGPYEELASEEFQGTSEIEVKKQVEEWTKIMINRVDVAIRKEFST